MPILRPSASAIGRSDAAHSPQTSSVIGATRTFFTILASVTLSSVYTSTRRGTAARIASSSTLGVASSLGMVIPLFEREAERRYDGGAQDHPDRQRPKHRTARALHFERENPSRRKAVGVIAAQHGRSLDAEADAVELAERIGGRPREVLQQRG